MLPLHRCATGQLTANTKKLLQIFWCSMQVTAHDAAMVPHMPDGHNILDKPTEYLWKKSPQ